MSTPAAQTNNTLIDADDVTPAVTADSFYSSENQELRMPLAPAIVLDGDEEEEEEDKARDDLMSNCDQETAVESYLAKIETAWQRTVQNIVAIGKLIAQAKDELGESYKQLEQRLPFSASEAGNFARISRHPVLSDPDYWEKLPRALNTLYHLSRLDDADVRDAIESGQITPALTVSQAKTFVQLKKSKRSGAKLQNMGAEEDYIDVVVSIRRTDDLSKALQDAYNFANTHGGMLDSRKNKHSFVEWRLKESIQQILANIDETKGRLKHVTLDQMRLLEEAAEALSKLKQDKKGPEPMLPDDYPDLDALRTLLGLTDITKKGVKKWCKDHGVPTRLALSDVDQPVYVWEQIRLIAEKQDENAAMKRLEAVGKCEDRAVRKVAMDALEKLERLADFESQAA